MKIAYVTTYDSSDIHNWSGTGFYIRKALESSGFQIEAIGNLRKKYPCLYRIKQISARLLGKRYSPEWEPRFLKNYARQVEKALAKIHYDIVFCPGTHPMTYLRTEKPIIFWHDSTFAGKIDFYSSYSNFCAETIKKGNMAAQMSLSKCCLAIYSSEWAANSAIRNYDVDPGKVKVVPFGANITCNRTIQDIYTIIENKNSEICRLLFIGVDWRRKGGDFAVNVADLLIQRGIRTELHIVGCDPKIKLPPFVKQHGFISKKTEEGRLALDRIMTESHFLILPSRAECSAIVFAEASSFGLPSVATKVGGIPTTIHDGKNGQTFSLDCSPVEYCDYIERLMSSRQEYEQLAISSFKEYSKRLNWESSGRKVNELIQEFCG